MRLRLVATFLCLLSVTAASAQEAPAEAGSEKAADEPGAPARKAPGPPPAQQASHSEESKPGKKGADSALSTAAQAFYRALAARDVDAVASLCRAPFFFEGKSVGSAEEIRRKWSEALQGRALPDLELDDVELLSYEEMVARFGRPPEKLSGWPIKGAMLSVGNLAGHAAIVLWKKNGQAWQAFGFHD